MYIRIIIVVLITCPATTPNVFCLYPKNMPLQFPISDSSLSILLYFACLFVCVSCLLPNPQQSPSFTCSLYRTINVHLICYIITNTSIVAPLRIYSVCLSCPDCLLLVACTALHCCPLQLFHIHMYVLRAC